VVLLIGGEGFVGKALTQALLTGEWAKTATVVVADVVDHRPCSSTKNISHVKLNICNSAEVDTVMMKYRPDVVVHLASYGMSGSAMLNVICRDINVDGTANPLESCIKHGVAKFVYTSTYNVVFGGVGIENGDETMPYFPLSRIFF
jgi:nucleoside-diphosphate-sugar epimerase